MILSEVVDHVSMILRHGSLTHKSRDSRSINEIEQVKLILQTIHCFVVHRELKMSSSTAGLSATIGKAVVVEGLNNPVTKFKILLLVCIEVL